MNKIITFVSSFSKISPCTRSVFKSNSPVHTHPMFGKRLDTILLRHRIRKYPDSPFTRYRIRCGFFFSFVFHSGGEILLYPDSLPNSPPNSPNVCGRKPYPERKSCGFKNIRIRVNARGLSNKTWGILSNISSFDCICHVIYFEQSARRIMIKDIFDTVPLLLSIRPKLSE